MKVTIKDIAQQANVSVSLVSLVLNHKPCRLSKETRERIVRIAKENNYIVNQHARSLVTKKSHTLGLVIPDIENIFFSTLCKNIEEYCRKSGYTLMIVNTNDKVEEDFRLIKMLEGKGVDGLFITVSNESFFHKDKMEFFLKSLSVPYVMVDRYYEGLEGYKTFFDNQLGAYLATKHLLAKGHRKIACISGPSNNGYLRLQGFQQAMQEYHIPTDQIHIMEGDFHYQSGYEAAKKVIAQDITGVFIANDMMTLGFLKYMAEQHKLIPEHYSIVSYDNTMAPYTQGQAISAIDQNVKELAVVASQLLIDVMDEKKIAEHEKCLSPQFVDNGSVKKI